MSVKQKKYVVTGAAGFIGSHITNALLAQGHKVVGVDNFCSGFRSYLPDGDENFTLVEVDISDWNELSKKFAYLQDADAVFHLAAIARIQPSIFSPHLTYQYNVMGTLNILEMMRMCKIPSIVYSASSSYYGKCENLPFKESEPFDCRTPYSASKFEGEVLCKTWGKLHGIRNVCLRYFNVYGRRSPLSGNYAPVVSKFFRQILTNKPMTIVGNGKQSRDMTHVGDVVMANISAAEKLRGPDFEDVIGKTLNIGTGTNYTINKLATMVGNLMNGFSPQVQYVPERIGETYATLADISLARDLLDWEPTMTLEEGLKDLKHYYSNNLEAIKSGRLDL